MPTWPTQRDVRLELKKSRTLWSFVLFPDFSHRGIHTSLALSQKLRGAGPRFIPTQRPDVVTGSFPLVFWVYQKKVCPLSWSDSLSKCWSATTRCNLNPRVKPPIGSKKRGEGRTKSLAWPTDGSECLQLRLNLDIEEEKRKKMPACTFHSLFFRRLSYLIYLCVQGYLREWKKKPQSRYWPDVKRGCAYSCTFAKLCRLLC